MEFTLEQWQEQARANYSQLTVWLHGATHDAGFAAYGGLTTMTVWPLVEFVTAAAQTGQSLPLSAILTLTSAAGSVGGNMLVAQIQNWYEAAVRGDVPTEADVLAWLAENVLTEVDVRTAVDHLLQELEAIPNVQTALPAVEWQAFNYQLRKELEQLGSLARFEAVLTGSGAIAQGKGTTAVGDRGVNVGGNVGGSVNTGDTYNYYVEGVRFYLPDFTTAVKNFLYNYLGDEANPVPFGGRDDALAQLEQWRTQTDAPPRLLLTAPAGRGKSALLVRWSVYLQDRGDVDVVFMPVSVRFNTNQEKDTFSLLATRLAHLYGKEIPPNWGNFPSDSWRRLVAEYLQEPLPDGHHLLLIIDGLDEAAWRPGADLFPHQLPERVRLVISARYRGGETIGPGPWLSRLGWERFPQMAATMKLETLTQAGIRDVLDKMGCPLDELGQKVDMIAELHRLSEGDPLLVELYVKDLWRRGESVTRLQPAELHSIQPGYQGYFERWWADQERLWEEDDPLEKALVNDVLDILAIAMGPLQIGDLHHLLPGQVHIRDLKRAIRSLNRFVLGDGQQQGYVFAHPKLSEYFRDQLEMDKQTTWQKRFLDWGEQVLDDLQAKRLRPLDVSRYLMLYYGRHLEEVKVDIEQLLQLVSWEWIQVWHKNTGTYAGFLQDVDLVWTKIRAINRKMIDQGKLGKYIGEEVRCALCHASINSMAVNFPDELLKQLLQSQVWTPGQVLTYARQKQDAEERAWCLLMLSQYLPVENKESIQHEVFLLVQRIRDDRSRSHILRVLADKMPESVMESSLQIEDEWSRARVLRVLAERTPLPISKAIQQIEDERSRISILCVMSKGQSNEQKEKILKEALRIAQQEKNEWSRAQILRLLAREIPREVFEEVQRMESEWSRAKVLSELAEKIPMDVLSEARQLKDSWWRTKVLIALVARSPTGTNRLIFREILIEIRRIEFDWSRARALTKLIRATPSSLLVGETLEMIFTQANQIRTVFNRAEVFVMLVKKLSVANKKETLLASLLKLAHRINDNKERAIILSALVEELPEENEKKQMLLRILEEVQQIQDEWWQLQLIVALVAEMPQKIGVFLEALRRTRNMEVKIDAWQLLSFTSLFLLLKRLKFPDKVVRSEKEVVFTLDMLIKVRQVEDIGSRRSALQEAVKPLLQLETSLVYGYWSETLAELSMRGRSHLSSDLVACLPVIKRLGGRKALAQVLRSTLDVWAWWP